MEFIGNEIENWAHELESYAEYGDMKLDDAQNFIGILMISKGSDAKEFEEALKTELGAGAILKSRFELFGYEMSNTIAALITCLVTPCIPGNLVMYANYLAYKCKVNHWDKLTSDNVCIDLFPRGGFTETTMNKAWQNQKVNGANLLDMANAGESIRKN